MGVQNKGIGAEGNRHTRGSWYYVWKGVYEIMENFPEMLPPSFAAGAVLLVVRQPLPEARLLCSKKSRNGPALFGGRGRFCSGRKKDFRLWAGIG